MVAGDCLENFAPLDASVDVSDDKDGLRLSNEVNFSQDKGMLSYINYNIIHYLPFTWHAYRK